VRAVGLSGRVLVSIWPVQVEEMTPGRAFNDASPAEALLPGLRAKACMAQRTNKLSPVSASTCRKVRLCVVPLVGKGVQPQYDEFDNGLSELIDLWSSTEAQAVKESALAHFKEDLEGAVLNWADNRAKSKKYAAIGKELAEFEDVLG